jgi:hypothetical protein
MSNLLYKCCENFVKFLAFRFANGKLDDMSLRRLPPPPPPAWTDPKFQLGGAAAAGYLLSKPQIVSKSITIVKKGLLYIARPDLPISDPINATVVADVIQHFDIYQCKVVAFALWTHPAIKVYRNGAVCIIAFLILTNLKQFITLMTLFIRYILSTHSDDAEFLRTINSGTGAKDGSDDLLRIFKKLEGGNGRDSQLVKAQTYQRILELAAEHLSRDRNKQ